MTETDRPRTLKLRSLESSLIKVRWFGVVFALVQIYMGADPACPAGVVESGCEPAFLRPLGYSLAMGLAALNLLAILLLRRSEHQGSLKMLGVFMFLVDHAFLVSFTWLYSFGEFTTLWIVLYILPLEGALRYGMRGAISSVGISVVTELARDFWRLATFGYEFTIVPGSSFRLGILTIVALVAGIMARNLERERDEVERRATALQELAERESAARTEIQAFYKTALAGVSGENLRESMQSMVETIGETLNYDSLAIALIEDTPSGQVLRVEGGYRYPKEAIGKTITMEEGVCGPVAKTGEPALVEDVRSHPSYLDFAPWARSEMAAPLKYQDRVIGVLNVESPEPGAFDSTDLQQLTRLAPGVAIVVQNARVLRHEHEAVERLTELDSMKSDFIAITSHELRTPLTSIRGFIKTLQRPGFAPTDDQLRDYLDIIDRQSERLESAIEDLLFISQLEKGTLQLQKESFDLVSVVKGLILSRFSDYPERLVLDAPQEELNIDGDPERCARVIGALIDNALKFSPVSSPIHITVDAKGEHAEVAVEDQGIGIAEEEHARIFNRFYQVGGAMGRPQSGFGLGLYICDRIAQSLGGQVDVESTPGQGATFTMRLPRKPSPSVESTAGVPKEVKPR